MVPFLRSVKVTQFGKNGFVVDIAFFFFVVVVVVVVVIVFVIVVVLFSGCSAPSGTARPFGTGSCGKPGF